ncbi:MAG: thioredoxin domain-containing protein [Blastomonas sp.]
MKTRLKLLFPATLALALAACGDGGDATDATGTAEVIAPIEAPAGQSWTETVAISDDGGYVMGNPDAPIRLVEYASLTCSHCRDFEAEAFDEIANEFVASGRVSFEMRNFLLNPYDIPLSLLTRCGTPQAYFPLTRQFFASQSDFLTAMQGKNQTAMQGAFDLPEDQRFMVLGREMGAIDYFSARGISADQAQACLSDPAKIKELLDISQKATNELDVSGTPTFFLNGQMYEFQGWPALKTRLQQLGAR